MTSSELGSLESRNQRGMENPIELVEMNGKKVSKNATGKRKFHKKSKNGCDNCKRRRVKCDESKPHCLKCEKMGLECVFTPVQSKSRKSSLNGDSMANFNSGRSETDSNDNDSQHNQSSDSLANNQIGLLANEVKEPMQSKKDTQNDAKPSKSGQENLLLPPLSQNSNMLQHLQQQLQQQPYLLPQLMTLTNSEKFAAQFELPNSPSSGLQSLPMNIASSIGSIFSGNKIPSNLANNLSLLQQLSQSPQKSGAKLAFECIRRIKFKTTGNISYSWDWRCNL